MRRWREKKEEKKNEKGISLKECLRKKEAEREMRNRSTNEREK